MAENFDVVVIGGGTAGLVTASGCARLGRRVALIERERLGGDCLWTGCVPTKALVASAKLAHQMRHAAAFGLEPVDRRVSPKRVLESMREQRRFISRHDDPQKFRDLGIEVIEGSARLLPDREVEVGQRRLAAKDVVIATGSRTAIPPVEGLRESGFLDHATFLAQDELPASIVVLGGGAIGVEFAQIFARFGAKVTIVEMADEILVHEDESVVRRIREILTAEGIELVNGWSLRSVRRDGSSRIATVADASGSTRDIAADAIFVATGRRGNTEDLGLEEAGVKIERSYVVVDRFLQTTAPRVWACGDVHGGLQFTHVAAHEAVKLVRNMLFPGKAAVDYEHVPWTLFTDPEAAHVGMTEREARAKIGDSVEVYQIEMADVDRAVVDRADAGLIKLVCDGAGRVLGAHVVCTNASTVIQEIVLARRKGMRVGELASRVSSYPSISDGVAKAAAQYYERLARGRVGKIGRRIASIAQ
jgi:pyruvate/2-oxoglutarate dehydrogenase complex dihydrolipoamide dehydrogenase (E3) component